MFLNFLDRVGRKKVVLDRGPSHPRFDEAKPWMNRYYVLLRYRPRWFPFNILIHEMLDNDHGEGVHNHLCPYITIVIRGGYWETNKTGKVIDIIKIDNEIISRPFVKNQNMYLIRDNSIIKLN